MKYNVETFLTNTSDQYVAQVAGTFDNFDSAKVSYHNTLAAYHNAPDVLHAMVWIVDEFGNPMANFREEVDHRPEPEPEPEPTPEPTPEPEGE